MRYIPGKTATILDHAGNCMRHGLPDQEREWSLDGRKAREASEEIKIEVKVCPRCLAAQEAGSDHCIFCGYLFEKKPRKEIKEQDGELVEMTEEMMARRRARKEQHRAVTLQELTDLGVERGYKYPVGWARHVMRSRHSRGVA
jgi:DNA repair protein RadD